MISRDDLPETWRGALEPFLASAACRALCDNLSTVTREQVVLPCQADWFRALHLTPLTNTNVVILGQDPYHGANQAHGLAFSVPNDVKIPPSLRNIYKEIATDIGHTPQSGDLTAWAEQGVLLLNTALTVQEGHAGSHRRLGWTPFINAIIGAINQQRDGVVFLLWGKSAQQWRDRIDSDKHHVLVAPHPSPLSAYRGFLGCRHFSQTNALLMAHKRPPITWVVPSEGRA